jgi:hypothetical protein
VGVRSSATITEGSGNIRQAHVLRIKETRKQPTGQILDVRNTTLKVLVLDLGKFSAELFRNHLNRMSRAIRFFLHQSPDFLPIRRVLEKFELD